MNYKEIFNKQKPHSRCNWITENILIGAEPIKETEDDLNKVIDIYINLTNNKYKYHKEKEYINFPIRCGKASAKKKTLELCKNIIKLSKNKVIYIHCIGGHGRTGMIASIIYGLMYNKNGPKSIKYIEESRNTRIDTSRNFIPTPESNLQVKLVISILGSDDEEILDRSDKSWMKRRTNKN